MLLLKVIEEKWDSIRRHTDLSLPQFLKAVEFLMDTNYFQYEDKYYKQNFGTPMGGGASGDFADIVMTALLDYVVEHADFDIQFLKKYIDDLIMGIELCKLQDCLKLFNSFNKHIQFTHEIEVDGKLPYLDMELHHHRDGSISTHWYKKPTASGRIVSYKSAHPLYVKINVAKNLIKRIFDLTQPADLNWCKKQATSLLKKNHYPSKLVNKLLNSRNNTTATNHNTTGEETVMKSIAYIPHLTDKITKLVKRTNTDKRIQFGYKCNRKLKSLHTKLKANTPAFSKSNVIYDIKCKTCPDLHYCGLTTQKLGTRVGQHRNYIKKVIPARNHLTDAIQQCRSPRVINGFQCILDDLTKNSAMYLHVGETGHDFDVESAKILSQQNDQRKLRFAECLNILMLNTCNFRKDVEGVSSIYSGILSHFKLPKTHTNRPP